MLYKNILLQYESSKEAHIKGKKNQPTGRAIANPGERSSRHSGSEGLRQEIWIRPDSGVTNKRTLSTSNDEPSHDPIDEITNEHPDKVNKKY